MNTKKTLAIFTVAAIFLTLMGNIGAIDVVTIAYGLTPAFAERKAPAVVSGDNVYVAWWTNRTGNDEVMFRASIDGGKTFGDKINLSNTTVGDSTRVEIDADGNGVVVTWWETNQTDDTPVMRVSNDNGKTFGPLLKLATNGTIDEEQ